MPKNHSNFKASYCCYNLKLNKKVIERKNVKSSQKKIMQSIFEFSSVSNKIDSSVADLKIQNQSQFS